MYEHTYRGVSRLAKEYFALLCASQGIHGTYDAIPEPEVPGKGQTYSIFLSGRETYNLMQRVADASNG